MNSKKIVVLILLISFGIFYSYAQELKDPDKQFSDFIDKKFKLQTFQIYQFMDRFNFDEKIFLDNVEASRNTNLYFLLNHKDSSLINSAITKDFITKILSDTTRFKLSYRYNDWFAKVKCQFLYKSKNIQVNIIMKFVSNNYGFYWVIDSVESDFFKNPQKDYSVYINPLNNEINFSELSNVLENENSIWSYTENKQYSALSSFQDYIKNGELKFSSIESIQYYFNNVLGYDFTVDYFMRKDMNAGWLISSIKKVKK